MKIPKKLPRLPEQKGSLKPLGVHCVLNSFHRIFYSQTIPLLETFANKPTQIILYLLYNTDTHNCIYCTYSDIMRGCNIKDKSLVSSTLKKLIELEAIVKLSESHYMLNPSLCMKGNDEWFEELAHEFGKHLDIKRYGNGKE